MPLTTNFNVDPYYDDYDVDKNYYRTLFKPGQAVQSRELTQIQTNLQDQIKKFGDHMFKTGSVVTGGQITVQNVYYMNIVSTYSGSDISANTFTRRDIVNSDGTKRGFILKAYEANQERNEPITFIVNQSYGEFFTDSEVIHTLTTTDNPVEYYANTAASDSFGESQAFSVDTGVFYYDGFFVQTQPQSIAIDKYSRQGNVLVGLVVSEDIVDYTEDTSLLDPAQSASNFQAPGADRYRIQLTLDTRSLDSTDLTKFVQLAKINNGVLERVNDTPIYGRIADEFARRTYEESGDYVVDNFQIALTDSDENSANANVSLGAGKAYIRGYDFRTIAPTVITIPKPRTTQEIINKRINSDYGYYIYANNYFGNFDTNQYENVAILAINTGQIPYNGTVTEGTPPTGTVNSHIVANATIGTAKVKLAKFYSAADPVTDATQYVYKLFLTDINTVSICANSGYGVNVSGGSKSTVFFPPNFAANNGVYKGMSIRIMDSYTDVYAGVDPYGPTDPSDLTTRIITDSFITSVDSLTGATSTFAGSGGQLAFSGSENQRLFPGQSITVSGTEVGTASLPKVASNSSVGLTLASPATTSTGGQFSCTARTADGLYVGQKVVISGTNSGSGSITGYSNPKAYRISATNGTSTFTLVDDATGAAIVTTVGTLTGLTFTLQGSAGSFYCDVPAPTTLAVGQVVTISGANVSGTSGSMPSTYIGVPTNYYITATDGTRNFTLSDKPGGTGLPISSGPLTGLSFSYAGRIIGYSNPTTYYISETNEKTTATIIRDTVADVDLSSFTVAASGKVTFSALTAAPKLGDTITIKGTFTGIGQISGHTDGKVYYVVGTAAPSGAGGNPTTTEVYLSATPDGGVVTTTAGATTGVTAKLRKNAVITVPGPNPSYTFSTTAGHVALVDPPFSTNPTNKWRAIIDSSFENAEAFVKLSSHTSGTRVASANISPLNKNQSLGITKLGVSYTQPLYQPASVQDRRSEPLLIKIGEANIADNTISDFSYAYQRLYQSVTFTGTTSSALSYGSGETLQDATTTESKRQYYRVVITNPSTSSFTTNQTVPAESFSVDTASRTITVTGGVTGMVANVFATINASNPTSKTKRYIAANTKLVDPAGGRANSVFGTGGGSGNNSVYVASLDGQTIIDTGFVVKRPGVPQYLFASDLHSLVSVYDFAGQSVTTANYNSGNYIDVTARYDFDTGQKDSYYGWGSITLKPGQNAPRGPLLVRYNRFVSSGGGFFNVDSYTRLGPDKKLDLVGTASYNGSGLDYGDIPIFTSQDGFNYALSDYLDFRPVRKDAGSLNQNDTYTANNFVLDVDSTNIGHKIALPELDIFADYQFYLPRIDRVVLTKNRGFQVLQGVPKISPVVPEEPEDAMTLYVLRYPAYLNDASSSKIDIYNNRRYTMRDLAKMDKRLQNLEIYTSLSIAELSVINKNDRTIRDANGLNRPKNGIFVDSFVDKTGSDITNNDYLAAIDIINKLCRGQSVTTSTAMAIPTPAINNQNIDVNGTVLNLASTNTTFVIQDKASKSINVNPFNVVNYLGTITLNPPDDIWKDEDRLEAQNIDLTGGDAAKDAWSKMTSTTWEPYKTSWNTSLDYSSRIIDVESGQIGGKWEGRGGAVLDVVTTVRSNKIQLNSNLDVSRNGTLTQFNAKNLTKDFGDRMIDLTVVHYMREKNILVVAEKFKPITTLHTFFDTVNVDKYVNVLNRLVFENDNLQFNTVVGKNEDIRLYAATDTAELKTTDTLIGQCGIVLTSGKNGWIINLPDTFASFGSWSSLTNKGLWAVGVTTGKTYHITGWYHTSGRAKGGSSVSTSVKKIILDYSVSGSLNESDLLGQKLYILTNTGAGESGTISDYNSTTREATVTGLTTTPDITSDYSIGYPETDEHGATAAVFQCPASVFRTGEKFLRLVDNEVGNIENSRTNGTASFYASGIIRQRQQTSISVFVPTYTQKSVTEGFSARTDASDTFTTSTTAVTLNHYHDPLAQTFFVNYDQYPQGIVVDSVRVCFRTKDVSEPVTCQLRPARNGYPASNEIYARASKTLTPDKVNITSVPDVKNSQKYTEFKFDIPVVLLPGEHSFVLLSNSTGYEAWIAGINDTDVVTGAKISEQPYTGSLFISQNGFTWTADQQNDLMFAIQKRVYTTGIGVAYLEADMKDRESSVYDLFYLGSQEAVMANTTLEYSFISELESGGQHTLLPFVPNETYECEVDNYGRRILNSETGNSTFQLRVTMTTKNPDITPMLDINRLNLITTANKINNLPLLNSGFVITNSGSGYSWSSTPGVNSNVKVTIGSGGDGSANAYANVTASGVIDKIVLDNAGSGYIYSPTVTIQAPSPGPGTTATAVYNGEDKAVGGNAYVRHLTKRIPLATGFDAGDLRVYMDLYRPPGSGILVWYKVLAESDPSRFDDNNWMLMTELSDTKNINSKSFGDFFEATFAPGEYGSGIASNKIRYTSAAGTGPHKDFAMFQLKIVLYASDTTKVPKFGGLRIIALPETTLVGTIIPNEETG